ncbi:MAG: sodium:solute symporter family protein [Planctomycetota bacterium]
MTQLIIIGCYLGLLLGLGLFASTLSRKTSGDYLLASHSIGPFLLLMSIFGTTMTAFALVGSTGESFKEGVGVYGMLASSSGIIHSLCFFVLGIPLWRLGRRNGYRTQIEFFRDRLESDKIGVLLFPILVALVIPYLLIGVMAAGGVINGVTSGIVKPGDDGLTVIKPTFEPGTFPEFLENGDDGTYATGSKGGVPRQVASLVICGVVLIYVFFGGMRGTAWANAFQTIVFMVLGIVTFCVLAFKIGNSGLPPDAEPLSFFDSLKRASEAIPFEKATRSEISQSAFLTYMFVPLSVGMFPHLFQHWLTAKSAESFKLPIVCHPVFIMIVWVPCVLVGAWATSDLVKVPPPVQANPNLLLPFLVKSQVGPVLTGFLTAGILAAIMSSLDSQFLCIGTMFTQDMALHYGGKERFSDGATTWIARGFIILVVALTYGFSLFEPRAVFTLGVWCFSGFAALTPLAFAAVYWRGLTKAGAYASVLAVAVSWAILFYQSDFAADRDFRVVIPYRGVAYETMPVLTMFVCSAVSLIAVSLFTKRPADETLAKFFPAK